MSLLDHNRQPIPACNIIDENVSTGMQFYVDNPEEYKKLRKDVESSRTVTLVAIVIFLLTMCIFSLNLTAAGWTAGNILTFAIIVGVLYVLTLYAKRWMRTNATLSEIVRNGNPCTRKEGDANLVFCKAHN